MSQRSYQKATRTKLLHHPTHSTLFVSYKDDSSAAAGIILLHCQRCLSYNLTTPSRANCGLNRARTAHVQLNYVDVSTEISFAVSVDATTADFSTAVRQHSVVRADEHNVTIQF